MAALSTQLSGSASTSTSTSTSLSPPQSMSYDEIDLDFADSKRTFTGLIKQYYDNPIIDRDNPRKRCRLTLFSYVRESLTKRITAYLLDEWSEIMEYFWNNQSSKIRENMHLSITFYGVRVIKIPEEDCDPVQEKNLCFILDRDTPDSSDIWIEFKTCCNRICGRNGIRLSKIDIINHLNNTNKLEIANNHNTHYLCPQYPYLPLSELTPRPNNGYIYGYITMSGDIRSCRGIHNFSKQIRIRDASLSWDSDDLQIMFFGNKPDDFPNARESDLIRLHRVTINYRMQTTQFQAVGALDKRSFAFIVIDGNLTIPNNKEAVRHSSSENYTFDDIVDGYFVKYLKEQCRIRQEQTNPDLININNINMQNMMNIPNVLTVNQALFLYLNEIQQQHDRINLVVMITARLDIDDDHKEDDDDNMDKMEFYWVVWDGSNCDKNKDLFQIYDVNGDGDDNVMDVDENEGDDEDDNKWEVKNIYNDRKIIGSAVKILVSPEYETAIQCYNDIDVGSWVELSNILVNHDKKQLIYDKHSKIYSKIQIKTNRFIQERTENVYYNIQQNTNIITHISSIIPHHQFQTVTLNKSILSIAETKCKYRIIGKCVGYHPINIQRFTKSVGNNQYKLQFLLYIKDASQSIIGVIFEGKEAEQFLDIDEPQDLTQKNSEQLQEIGHCMQLIMNSSSIIDLCFRSFQPKGKQLIGYKAFDTVLIK